MIALALALALAATPSRAIVVGPGNASCAIAMAPAHRKRSFDYIWGVWTGMNIASNKPAGHTMNSTGILKEVVSACLAYPKLPLADAVLGVHMQMERLDR